MSSRGSAVHSETALLMPISTIADNSEKTKLTASLGTTANTTPTQAPTNAKTHGDNLLRYRELSFAQKILSQYNVPNQSLTDVHRTRVCHLHKTYQADSISVNVSESNNSSRASLSGVQTCSSVWSCPVCASRIALERRSEIKKALSWADENDYMVFMVTLTARHNIQSRLKSFRHKFKLAHDDWNGNGTMYRLRKKHRIRYTIKSVEVTYGDNGWHYHYHILMFIEKKYMLQLDDSALEMMTDKMRESWVYQLNKHGLSAVGEHALNVQAHGNVTEKYLTKLGVGLDDTTDASYEMTGNQTKDKSVTVWSILSKARRGYQAGDGMRNKWSRLYSQYCVAMMGQAWITWTPKFKDLVGINDIDDDTANELQAELERETMRKLLDISSRQFKAVRHYRAVADLLSIAGESKDVTSVTDWLDTLREYYDESQYELMVKRMENAPVSEFENLKNRVVSADVQTLAHWIRCCQSDIDACSSEMIKWRDTGDSRYQKNADRRRVLNKYLKYMKQSLSFRQPNLL